MQNDAQKNDAEEMQAEIMAALDQVLKEFGAVAATAIVTFEDGRQWKLVGAKKE